jgi:uncharacterized protein
MTIKTLDTRHSTLEKAVIRDRSGSVICPRVFSVQCPVSILSFFLSAFLILPACAQAPTPRACFKGACYSVEIAQTPESRQHGLMEREGLKPGTGMLFVFDEPGRYGFWMKNMKFPIDILWLDNEEKVVHIAENVPPCQSDPCPAYMPPSDARYVLEIPAGDAVKSGVSTSEKAILEAVQP